MIAVLSDHGEGLGDHGHGGHNRHTHEEETHVARVLQWQGRLPAGRVVHQPAQSRLGNRE